MEAKTNDRRLLWGHSMCHTDVWHCSLGGLGMCLLCQFEVTGEMEEPPDFTNNKAWHNTKLLVETQQGDCTEGISNKSHADEMKILFSKHSTWHQITVCILAE